VSRARTATAVALALLAGCATGAKLQRAAEAVQVDVEKARKSGAMKCAPKELALAETNLEFGVSEMDGGNASRAASHLKVAEQSVKRALELSKSCGPAQVTIRPARPPVEVAAVAVVAKKPVIIEKIDSDGDGVPDLEDKCPSEPGPKENAGCPVVKDSDGDGIPDDIDRCPLDPEDFDGFQDEDGCPDPDNDGDGIVDKVDACPNTPGPIENRGCPVLDRDGDGIPDLDDKCPDVPGLPPDGCPKKYTLVEVKKDRIAIKQQVHFASAKWKVLADSFGLLDQVAQVIKDFPRMRVSVEGHTDNVGAETMNMKLSQARADEVRAYLVKKGVAEERLEAIGFGPTKPIASNKTETGRGQNRRTEFRIVSME
jgi:OOP family OmpA-OmpF porin